MDPVSFMEREISQLINTKVEYKDRLFIGNCHLVCPHHKLMDLIGVCVCVYIHLSPENATSCARTTNSWI